jgi:hypothetical protein
MKRNRCWRKENISKAHRSSVISFFSIFANQCFRSRLLYICTNSMLSDSISSNEINQLELCIPSNCWNCLWSCSDDIHVWTICQTWDYEFSSLHGWRKYFRDFRNNNEACDSKHDDLDSRKVSFLKVRLSYNFIGILRSFSFILEFVRWIIKIRRPIILQRLVECSNFRFILA